MGLEREATALLVPSGLRTSPAPPVVMSKPNAVRMRVPGHGQSRRAAVPARAPSGSKPATPPCEEVVLVRANRREEVIETCADGALPNA